MTGKLLIRSSSPSLYRYPKRSRPDYIRQNLDIAPQWKVKRFSIEVDGYIIDGTMMGREETLENGRWLLISNGIGLAYESRFRNTEVTGLMEELDSNAILFNYPGVAGSSGMPTRYGMVKAYHGMLHFLEDQKNGIGAKEIIGYGHSMGGGIQGDTLRLHRLKDDIRYVFVKSRTFSDLGAEFTHLFGAPFGSFIRSIGWNVDSVESSKKLQVPEIIIQTADTHKLICEDLEGKPEKTIDDDVIPAEASLAKKLLADLDVPQKNKYFMGVSERHTEWLSREKIRHLADKIQSMIKMDK